MEGLLRDTFGLQRGLLGSLCRPRCATGRPKSARNRPSCATGGPQIGPKHWFLMSATPQIGPKSSFLRNWIPKWAPNRRSCASGRFTTTLNGSKSPLGVPFLSPKLLNIQLHLLTHVFLLENGPRLFKMHSGDSNFVSTTYQH